MLAQPVKDNRANIRMKKPILLISFALLKRKIKHVYIMSGNRFKLRPFGGVEGLAMVPRIFDGRDHPKVAIGITHNPTLGSPLYK